MRIYEKTYLKILAASGGNPEKAIKMNLIAIAFALRFAWLRLKRH
jgi:hypothetical protein